MILNVLLSLESFFAQTAFVWYEAESRQRSLLFRISQFLRQGFITVQATSMHGQMSLEQSLANEIASAIPTPVSRTMKDANVIPE